MMYHSFYLSPIGWFEITADEHFLYGVNLVLNTNFFSAHENALTQTTAQELADYFSYHHTTFTAPLAPNQGTFAMDIYRTLQKTKAGEVISYSALARQSGHPQAARAVGNALHKNPWMIIVPCHRVIKNNGDLGGFALDREIKLKLLQWEKSSGGREGV